MDLSVIIVSWKVKERLEANLKALYKSQGNFTWEVFVVDNNSQDGTVEMIKKMWPSVKLIANTANLGFARANNLAIKQAKGEFILLLNPDMRVKANTLSAMLDFIKSKPQASVASCKLITENGEIIKHVRNFPKLLDQLIIILKLPHIFQGLLRRYLNSDFDYNQAARVESVRGSFFMMRNSEPRPSLDERYFIWFEEVDFCREVYKSGGEVWYTPTAECYDYIGQSFKKVSRRVTQKYFADSMIKYFKKWEPRWQAIVLKILWPLGKFLAFIFGSIKRRNK